MPDRLPEQSQEPEESALTTILPTEYGGQRWETTNNWLAVGASSLLYATAIVGAGILLASTQIPEISQLAGKLVEKVVTPATFQAVVGVAIVAAAGLGTFYGSRDRGSLFRS